MSHLLFVYGTCKRGQRNNRVLFQTGCSTCLLGVACTTEAYPLVTASQFNLPFLLPVKGLGEIVWGEVYRVDETLLQKMDKFECVPVLYHRQNIAVRMADDGRVLECISYMLTNHHPALLHKPFISNYDEKLYPVLTDADETTGLPSMPTGIQVQSVAEM